MKRASRNGRRRKHHGASPEGRCQVLGGPATWDVPNVDRDVAVLIDPSRSPAGSIEPARASVDADAILGDSLHALRRRASLTCEQAAQRAGLSPTRVRGLEGGDGLLPFTDALPLLRAYGTTLSDFAREFDQALARAQSDPAS